MPELSRRQYGSWLVLGVMAAVLGWYEFLREDEESDAESPHSQTFDELSDGGWHSNVEFDLPVEDLRGHVIEAGAVSSSSLTSHVEIDGEFEYDGSQTVRIGRMELEFMLGENAIVDSASVEFDPPKAVSGIRECDPSRQAEFEFSLQTSGVQGADTLVITVPEEAIEVSNDC